VPAVKVGAVEQVVAVEFAEVLLVTLALADGVRLADVVMVESVDEDVTETDELLETTEELLLLEITDELLLLEITEELLLLEITEELLDVTDGATEELELELVEVATDEELEDVTQPLICFAPHTPELALATPTAFLR
jgi:hypothetical protein